MISAIEVLKKEINELEDAKEIDLRASKDKNLSYDDRTTYEEFAQEIENKINALGVALLALERTQAELEASRKLSELTRWLEKEIERNKIELENNENLFRTGKGREVDLVRYDKERGKQEVLKEVLGFLQ